MAGYSPNRVRAALRASKLHTSDDPCSFQFQVELVGVRSAAASQLAPGHFLDVALIPKGDAVSVVCQTFEGDVVGALAAFRGLARLIGCLRDGLQYQAEVVEATATRCEVRVGRYA